MAQRLGLSLTSWSRYERGRRKIERVVAMAARCLLYHGGTGR